MADVLLITDQQRVSAIFTSAAETVAMRLRIVPTLAQGEEEIAVAVPSHAFVESTISGLSAEEVVQHLRGLLPPSTQVVLLSADTGRADYPGDTLNTSRTDEELLGAVAARVASEAAEGSGEERAAQAPGESAKDLLFSTRYDNGETERGTDRRMPYAAALVAALVLAALGYHFAKDPRPAPVVRATPQQVTAVKKEAAPQGAPPAAPGAPPARYLVQPGDTILKILAVHFAIGETEGAALLPEIKRLNNMKELRLLQPGQTLLIPAIVQGKRD